VAATNIDILQDGRAIADGICYAPANDPTLTGDRMVPTPDSATPMSARAALAFYSRFVVLQAVGAAIIAALWIAGLAGLPFEGENAPICWLILAIGGIGVALTFFRRWRDVQWVATHVVRIGLLGTVIGLIVAFAAARDGGSADAEQVKSMIASVVDGMYVSLYATLLGIAVNLWLKINLRLLGHHYG
jgi:MotA/TolQ/ExbB proton channel family